MPAETLGSQPVEITSKMGKEATDIGNKIVDKTRHEGFQKKIKKQTGVEFKRGLSNISRSTIEKPQDNGIPEASRTSGIKGNEEIAGDPDIDINATTPQETIDRTEDHIKEIKSQVDKPEAKQSVSTTFQPETSTGKEILDAFKALGGAVKEGSKAKGREYDERIKAVLQGKPLKPTDTLEGLKKDFKDWTKEEWTPDFDFEANRKRRLEQLSKKRGETPVDSIKPEQKISEEKINSQKIEDPSLISDNARTTEQVSDVTSKKRVIGGKGTNKTHEADTFEKPTPDAHEISNDQDFFKFKKDLDQQPDLDPEDHELKSSSPIVQLLFDKWKKENAGVSDAEIERKLAEGKKQWLSKKDQQDQRQQFLQKQDFDDFTRQEPAKTAEAVKNILNDEEAQFQATAKEKINDTREQLLGNKEAEKPEFLEEKGEREIIKTKQNSISKLENKLVRTGLFNKNTAGEFIINFLAGEKDPWGQAKAKFANEQWSQAKEILKDRVEKAIDSIKNFDSIHENYCKYSSEVFGKYIDNLEQAFKSSEYSNNKEMVGIQNDLQIIKGLFENNSQNLKQWRGKHKGLSGLMRNFRLAAARKFGDKEGKVVKAILAEDNNMRQALEASNKALIEKLQSLQKKINGEIDAIPENRNVFVAGDNENDSVAPVEGTRDSEVKIGIRNRMGQIYSNLLGKNGNFEATDLAQMQEFRDLLNTYPDVKFEYKDNFGSTVTIKNNPELQNTVRNLTNSLEQKSNQAKVENKSAQNQSEVKQETTQPKPAKRLFTRRSPLPAPPTEDASQAINQQTTAEPTTSSTNESQPAETIDNTLTNQDTAPTQETIQPVELSGEQRNLLNDEIIKNQQSPDSDGVKIATIAEELEKLQDVKDSPEKDIKTLMYLRIPSVDMQNLTFSNEDKETDEEKRKILAQKLDEYKKKYAGVNDRLSSNIQRMIGTISRKFQINPTQENLTPTNA